MSTILTIGCFSTDFRYARESRGGRKHCVSDATYESSEITESKHFEQNEVIYSQSGHKLGLSIRVKLGTQLMQLILVNLRQPFI